NKLTNFRPPEKQKEALLLITELPEGIIYIARSEQEIVGYVTFHRPDEWSRWFKHPLIVELGGIEISADWRRCKIADTLLKAAFDNPVMERYIVITMEISWHWDTANANLDLWAYQKMLTNLFGAVGLRKVATDDPDIIEHPANVLMARVGHKVSSNDILSFENLKFMDRTTPIFR
ncbi:MAG: GNAT family N-acetyltransferase, partial [Firmicutes bacterium]|nr:GNAT family N-acetyltransferase [Bacillota bacterium]